MRRLVVLLSVIVALGALVPLGALAPVTAVAQDTTPEARPETPAAAQAAALARTDARYVLPYGPDGLHPGLTAAANVSGVCGFSSLMTTGRPDAWDCLGDDNRVYDPCFENPFAPADEPGEVVCFASPFASDIVLMALDEPLVREKEIASGTAFDPWDLPWALELANGERCLLLATVDVVLAGQSVHYGCADGGSILGEVDRGLPVWTVSYLAAGAMETTRTGVSVAWS